MYRSDAHVQLEAHLKTRTFFVGSNLSLADVAVFAAVSPQVTAMKPEDRSSLSSLHRWYDHLHFCAVSAPSGSSHVADTFPPVQLSKVPFRMPPPAAPVSKAAKVRSAPSLGSCHQGCHCYPCCLIKTVSLTQRICNCTYLFGQTDKIANYACVACVQFDRLDRT